MRALVHTLQERRRTAARPIILGELLVVFVLLRVYDYVKSLESVRALPALTNGRDVLSIEGALHLNIESSVNHWASHHHSLSTALVWWYQYSHITGTMIVLACCYLWFPHFYRSARNALILTNCAGMLVFALLPVMPPRLLPHAGFIDSVALAGYGTDHGGPVEPAQFAAMPSLHLAWAMWVGMVLFAMLKGVPHRAVAFLYPATTTIAVIATGNHYVLDVLAGVGLALITLTVCGFLKYARGRSVVVVPTAEAIPIDPPLPVTGILGVEALGDSTPAPAHAPALELDS